MRFSFCVDPRVASLFPSARIGILIGAGVNNSEQADLDMLIQQVKADVQARFGAPDAMSRHAHIQCWRDAYRKMGVSPKKHRPTMEALLTRVLKVGHVPRISTIVDLYLLTELTFVVPYGGYDLSKLDGELHLRLSPGNEPFTPIGGEGSAPERTDRDEVVYHNAGRVLTRRWNYRDAESTKIDESTRSFVLMCEAADERIPNEAIAESLCHLEMLLRSHSPGEARFHADVLDLGREAYCWDY